MNLWKCQIQMPSQIFVEYMKKQLGSLDTHLMSTVLPETMLGDGVVRPLFLKTEDGKLAGFVPLGGRMWRGLKSEAFLPLLLLVPKLTLEFPRVSHPKDMPVCF